MDGDELTKVLTELSQRGLAHALDRAASQGGEPRWEGRKIGGIQVGRYRYGPIDKTALLIFVNNPLDQWQAEYGHLKTRLGQVGWISEG